MEFGKQNLWVSLTVIMPGFATYGLWRLVGMILHDGSITYSAFDGSVILALSVVAALALAQQAVAIVVEAVLTRSTRGKKGWWQDLHTFLVKRHDVVRGEGGDDAPVLRTTAQVFLSANTLVGCLLVLALLVFARSESGAAPLHRPGWLYSVVGGLSLMHCVAMLHRLDLAVKDTGKL